MLLTKSFFINNRKSLIHQVSQQSLIVITANSLLQRSADTTYPFRQDSNFYYLTGINEPDLVLVINGSEEFLILPKRSAVEDIFGGSIDCDEIAKISGVMTIYSHSEGWHRYKQLQQSRKAVSILKPAPSKISGIDSFFTNPARRYVTNKIKRINSKIELKDIRPILMSMRQIKQPEEIKAIEQAITITGKGFIHARELIAAGATEYELEAEFNKLFTNHQAKHSYQPIIAGGSRACVLHYIKNNQSLGQNELCLLDVGAEYSNYSADITRTYGSAQSARQAEVVNAVKDVQDYAISIVKPGLGWREYVKQVEEKTGQMLVKLKLINSISSSNVRKYFPHGVSHSLGLDVHDVCDYKELKENMVITVEPGIYIPEENIGVRIEDNILITKTCAVNLSKDIPY